MIQSISIGPGITLRYFPDQRFKHACLSVQAVRPMCREEAALNALLPAVLLRGTESCPDLRSITARLDDLYGASVGTLVRRVGDYQTTGLYASFIEDRFAMEGDRILAPMGAFLKELLRAPRLEKGLFRADYVKSEKKNLISTIESQLGDKRAYAMEQLMRSLCRKDSFGLPRLGEKREVAAITPGSLFAHYQKVLRESPIEIFYVGAAPLEAVRTLAESLFLGLGRNYVNLPEQTPLVRCRFSRREKRMNVNQGKLCMGFVTDVTLRDGDFPAMQLLNMVFGGDATSKLFRKVREEQSLCYAIGSGYHGSKGILTVSAGIDSGKEETVKAAILSQLEACRRGEISESELQSAREELRSGLLATHDSPGAIESYYATAALSGFSLDPEAYMARLETVTTQQLRRLAQGLKLSAVFFLRGVDS